MLTAAPLQACYCVQSFLDGASTSDVALVWSVAPIAGGAMWDWSVTMAFSLHIKFALLSWHVCQLGSWANIKMLLQRLDVFKLVSLAIEVTHAPACCSVIWFQ